ncbi:hypothetical protein Ddc_21337 [Ditylenchus destructor]|nr:hypothetical protein Ddc_21337 [Ditylenchus destructor]
MDYSQVVEFPASLSPKPDHCKPWVKGNREEGFYRAYDNLIKFFELETIPIPQPAPAKPSSTTQIVASLATQLVHSSGKIVRGVMNMVSMSKTICPKHKVFVSPRTTTVTYHCPPLA